MSPDPFDLLRDQLVTAAAPRRVAARRRWRPLVVLAAALALGGTATAAAVLTLSGEPSPPLKGRVPGGGGGNASAVRAYAVVLRPDLRVGAVGWCSTVALRGERGSIAAGSGCGPAAQAAYPQISGGGMSVSNAVALGYWIVDRRVAAVRLRDGTRILPRADAALPFGWRAAVAFVTARRGAMPTDALTADLLGADGRVLLAGSGRTADAPRGVPSLPARPVDAHRPPARRCAIGHRALPHLAALEQTIATGALNRPVDTAGRPFRTCSTALFRLDGVRLRAAVLVDARDPSRPAAALPRGYVGPLAAARRVGRAWLVVDGGTNVARRRLLAGLTTRPPRG
ncbi:MAG TPA: hypothetical protein VFG42_10375 [Baekduia sp.]|uniref:hypothetical protein n=1 Tax=Baekduia sp. TaxID=2600305 RepID=UPI002D77356B|nr:hypothetical protein [Baekduia sp.]HET6507187.1 hypothetical protein [Baekduia sp.]